MPDSRTMSLELTYLESSYRRPETSKIVDDVAEEEEASLYMQDLSSARTTLRLLAWVLVLMTLPGFLVSTSEGQVTTAITSDGSLGTIVNPNETLHDITGGTRPGDGLNLFHSFGQFTVGSGDTANFLNDSGLPTSNILSRVTGGDPSQIFGILQTTGFGAASLYLLNPAGVMFGPDATLNVGGSFHVSTADFLRLEDNGTFFANLAEESVLTMAMPEAFGFLNGNPSSITLDQAALDVPTGETISLVGGDIEISGGNLTASNGQISLVSVASPSEVGISQGSELQIDAAQLGSIDILSSATVQARGDTGGTVVIRGGQLLIDESTVATSRTGIAEDSLNGPSKAEIDIQVVNDVVVDNGAILELSVLANLAESPNPDRINISAGHLEIGKGSIIQSSVLPSSQEGQGGEISLTANSILMRDAESQVTTSAGGLAGGGDIVVDVEGEIAIRGSSILQTLTSDEAGKAGDIQVKADKINIKQEIFDGPPPVFLSGFLSFTDFDGKGNTGDIRIETNDLQMIDGFISTFTETGSEGNAGNIELLVDGDFSLMGSENEAGVITTNPFGSGNAGEIFIRANNLRLANDSHIQTVADIGDAAMVDIRLQGTLDVREGSTIDTFTFGGGAAGDMIIMARDILIKGAFDQAKFSLGRTGLSVSSTPGTGPGGDLTIMAENLHVTELGSIRSVTMGPGAGGDINVMVGELSLTNGATVTAESIATEDGAANAGNIDLKANDTIFIDNARVTAQAENALGGNIKLDAGNLIQVTDSEVTSRVREGAGSAGSISLDPDFIVIQNSKVLSTAVDGDGGPIFLAANSAILVDAFSQLNASSQFGGDGAIDIQAPIQNLSGTIAPLPEKAVPVNALYSARCAAGQGGHFSTFVDSKADSLSPRPSVFLASPLLSLSSEANAVADASAGLQSPIALTASIAPLVLGHADEPTTACP